MSRKTRIFSDLDLNFTMHPVTHDLVRKLDDDAVRTSMRNLILTNHYERPFHSNKGSGLRALLFELPSPMLKVTIERTIMDLLLNFEPRVSVIDVNVEFLTDDNSVRVSIEYKIINNPLPQTLAVILERSR